MERISLEHARELLGGKECTGDLVCCSGGDEQLCRVRSIGSDSFLICLEKKRQCSFAISFGGGFLCTCRVRIHIARMLGE